jgi:hypothetical protein
MIEEPGALHVHGRQAEGLSLGTAPESAEQTVFSPGSGPAWAPRRTSTASGSPAAISMKGRGAAHDAEAVKANAAMRKSRIGRKANNTGDCGWHQ